MYEYDPCDYLKAQEFQLKRDIPDYKKTQGGRPERICRPACSGPKGRVHFQVASCINEELEKLDRSLFQTRTVFSQISALIDRRIPCKLSYVSLQLHSSRLLSGELQAFRRSLYHRREKTSLTTSTSNLHALNCPIKTSVPARKMLLMYANPLTNYLATRTDNPK